MQATSIVQIIYKNIIKLNLGKKIPRAKDISSLYGYLNRNKIQHK